MVTNTSQTFVFNSSFILPLLPSSAPPPQFRSSTSHSWIVAMHRIHLFLPTFVTTTTLDQHYSCLDDFKIPCRFPCFHQGQSLIGSPRGSHYSGIQIQSFHFPAKTLLALIKYLLPTGPTRPIGPACCFLLQPPPPTLSPHHLPVFNPTNLQASVLGVLSSQLSMRTDIYNYPFLFAWCQLNLLQENCPQHLQPQSQPVTQYPHL